MKTIKIKDYYGIYQEIPVTDELYEECRQMQNETQRIRKKEIYHRNWTTLEDIDSCLDHPDRELEDELILREEIRALYEAIDKLTPTQQRRIRMYMENMSIRDIAEKDGCYMNAALKSINSALRKLHALLTES